MFAALMVVKQRKKIRYNILASRSRAAVGLTVYCRAAFGGGLKERGVAAARSIATKYQLSCGRQATTRP